MTEVTVDPEERFLDFLKGAYRKHIRQMGATESRSLKVDYSDFIGFDGELAKVLLQEPDRYAEAAEKALKTLLKIEAREYAEAAPRLHVRFRGIPQDFHLRELGSRHIRRMVSFNGIVVRASPVKPLVMRGVYKCRNTECENLNTVDYPPEEHFASLLKPPTRCSSCGNAENFEFVAEKSEFVDSQILRVQERPEDLPPGQLPRSIEILTVDDLVDMARPGDRVAITGVLRSRPEIVPLRGRLRLFDIFVTSNYIEVAGKETDILEISPEEEAKIKEIAKKPTVHRDIINSIAPSIYGYEDIKEAIMYHLFGGTQKTTSEGISVRGDIHILLVGDPGIGKSQLLMYVAKASPRGLYTSGRGTTAAGLTAAVLKEKSGGMTLEAGALVLADKGVACVDEIEKMRDEDRIAMHEGMEQQSVSIAKGGIVATLNARTSILAAANPKLGRYEDSLTVSDNIDIPIVLLSRFDLIFILRDRPIKEQDEKLSAHILALHKTPDRFGKVPLPPDVLRKYISYAKSHIHPVIGKEASQKLQSFYLKMRESSSEAEGSPVAITPRQLEAIIRIATARTKVALREEVTAADADAAIRIMQKSLRDVGAMKEDTVDIDVIMTGKTASMREAQTIILKLVSEMEKADGQAEEEQLFKRLEEDYKMNRDRAERILRKMKDEGSLWSPNDGVVKKTRA